MPNIGTWLKAKWIAALLWIQRQRHAFSEWLEARRMRRNQRTSSRPPDHGAAPPQSPAATQEDHNPPSVPEDWATYRLLQAIGIVISVGFIAWGILDWNGTLYQNSVVYFNVGPLPVIIGAGYFFGSFAYGIVRETEIAGAYSYGYALVNLNSGPHFIPLGLMYIDKLPRGVQKIQVPADNPDRIFHGPDNEELPPGMVRTLRILSGGPEQAATAHAATADPLDVRMMLEANYVVQWRITKVLDFRANYVNRALVEEQIRDVGDPTLAEEFSKKTPAEISRTLDEVNRSLATNVGKRFEHSGADFVSTRVSIDPGRTVSEGLAKVPVARAEAQAAMLRAEGDKQATELRAEGAKKAAVLAGEGEGQADKARFTGRGEGMKHMRESLGLSGAEILAAETSRDLAKTINEKADTLVIGAQGGLSDIVGITKTVQAALSSSK